MFEIRDMQRVGWRNRRAEHHYVGSLTLTDDSLRLTGHENAGGLDATVTIPLDSIRHVALGASQEEELAGGRSLVLDLADGESVVVRPIGTGRSELHLITLLGRLQRAVGERPSALRAAR